MLIVMSAVALNAAGVMSSMGYNGRLFLSAVMVFCVLSGGRCEDRTVLFRINLRNLMKFNFTAFRHDFVDFFRRVENRLNATYRFLRYNGSLAPLCGVANEQCNATARCCPEFMCVPSVNISGVFNCVERNESSSEEVGNRIRSLYTDGSGSHEWTNSWAFESRSTLEREEELYKEEKEWKEKNVLDSTEETVWQRLVNEIVKRGKEQFDKLQKMKKLNEVKQIIKEKLAKRHEQAKQSGNVQKQKDESKKETNVRPTKAVINTKTGKQSSDESENEKDENSENNGIKSEENLSSVLKSAEDLVKRHKKKHREQLKKKTTDVKASEVGDISWNEDELQKEIEKLKALKEEQKANKMTTEYDRLRQDEMNDLIKKQVALILDEERKLEGLMKLEELKKLEDNMKRRAS